MVFLFYIFLQLVNGKSELNVTFYFINIDRHMNEVCSFLNNKRPTLIKFLLCLPVYGIYAS